METDQTKQEGDYFDGLMTAFREYDARRRPEQEKAAEEERDARRIEILRACCLVLTAAPFELGLETPSSPPPDEDLSALEEGESAGVPEARACRLWMACCAGEDEPDTAAAFGALVEKPLWEPVAALVYRALAYYGQRRLLRELLPDDGPLTLAQADAWLEATHCKAIDADWTGRIVPAPDDALTPELREKWIGLLKAETALARGDLRDTTENDLEALASVDDSQSAESYSQVVSRRIAARAATALARLRLAQWCAGDASFNHPAGQFAPVWERNYLEALGRWQVDDCDAAAGLLRASIEHNRRQTCSRAALAALLARHDPEEALAVLEHDCPTRELLVSRAALLARLGRYDKAEEALAPCTGEGSVGHESPRFSWPDGRRQFRRREHALRAALSERNGDWKASGKAWRSACEKPSRKSLRSARQFFCARRALNSLPEGQRWQRSILEQQVKSGQNELGAMPLAGDALFFRASAILDTDPERAGNDFATLLRRHSWIDAERTVGGGRLIFAGDTLARLDRAGDAIRAWELVKNCSPAMVSERLAVMHVFVAVEQNAGADELSEVLDRADQLAPNSFWPQLIAALGLLVKDNRSAASERVEKARKLGAPQAVCRCVRALCADASTPVALADEDLHALELPGHIEAALRLIGAPGAEKDRIKAFVNGLGDEWVAKCPVDPAGVARRLLALLFEGNNWDEALEVAGDLERAGSTWARELAALVRLRHALQRAGRGELQEAERELEALESALR